MLYTTHMAYDKRKLVKLWLPGKNTYIKCSCFYHQMKIKLVYILTIYGLLFTVLTNNNLLNIIFGKKKFIFFSRDDFSD